MPVITLTTEWKTNDYYLGVVKGAILSRVKDVSIVEISNQVSKFNTAQAAFKLKNSYEFFPKGTVHLVAVKSEGREENPYIAFEAEGQYFVGTDNGTFGLIFEEKPGLIVEIAMEENQADPDICNSTFPEFSVLAKAASFLANGGDVKMLGFEKDKLYRTIPMLPTIEESVIVGSVLYIDSYNNAITNISLELFEQVGEGRAFDIFVQNNFYKINRINKSYGETSDGELLAIFNSINLLEIAINNGNAAELLHLDTKSNIRIKFYDHKDS